MRSGTSEGCSPSSPPAPNASRCSRRARAATTRRRSTQPPRPLSSTGSRRSTWTSRWSRKSSESASSEPGTVARRLRPDRRLAQREARHPFLFALAGGRGRRRNGRRRVRLRLRLRHRRGVDGRARPGRLPEWERLGAVRPKDAIEILSFEATTTAQVADKAAAMVGTAYRLRIMGSLAISLCHLAAGRVDAVCSLKAARSVDIAAGHCSCASVALRSSCSRTRRSSRRRWTSSDVHDRRRG